MNKEKKELWHQGEIGPDVVLRDVCKDTVNNVLVAVGDDGRIYRRYGAGVGWMTCVSGFYDQDNVYGVATNNNDVFVAGGRGGFISRSTDQGVTWSTKRKISGEEDVTKIAYGNGMFLAILDKGKVPGNILCSKDGDSWKISKSGVPNGASIEFLNGKFIVGCKNGNIFYGNGTDPWNKCWWEKNDVTFTGARCVGYNPETGLHFSGGHQVATSREGVKWTAVIDLTRIDEIGNRNIHAIVPVGKKTFLFGEDCLIFVHDGVTFEQVGGLGKGSVLGAVLHECYYNRS